MLRLSVLPICLLAAAALSVSAAQAAPHKGAKSGAHAPAAAGDLPPPPSDRPLPPPVPVGYDAAYDYSLANNPASDAYPYYQYAGPQPTDPRAREQGGLRYGTLAIKPLTPYDDGVDYSGGDDEGYGYGSGYGSDYGSGSDDSYCGCAHYGRRYNVYYDDYGRRGDSYREGDDRQYDTGQRDDRGRGYNE